MTLLFTAYLANYISPAQVWFFGFTGMAFPYILIINLGCILFWLVMRRKYVYISLLAILIGWGTVRRTFQINIVNHRHTDNSIKVMSYNVKMFGLYSHKNFDVRDSILTYIKKQHPDIICFQEFGTIDNIDSLSEDYLKSYLPFVPYSHIHHRNNNTKKASFGIAIFSSYPIINKGRFEFTKSVNMCIYADIVYHYDTIRVFNMHLESTGIKQKKYNVVDNLMLDFDNNKLKEVKRISSNLRDAFQKRSEQVDYMAYVIKNSPYPVMVCGDFNDTPVSYSYSRLKRKLRDSFVKAGNGTGTTYHESFPSFRIDYIFHDRKYKVRDYHTSKIDLSDHYPIYCVLSKRR